MISLHIEPGRVCTPLEFRQHPPYSIALDGYVSGAPFLEVRADGPRRNFNHHEGVDRSCTLATCEQVRRAVLLGLYDLFRSASGYRAELWVNDCDQDVALSTWILMHPERAAEPAVRQLSQITDLLDSSGGMFPMRHELPLLAQVRWVFEPYAEARSRMAAWAASDLRAVIEQVHDRITRFVDGRGVPEQPISEVAAYTDLFVDSWHLVEVHRPQARDLLVAAGVRAAVELTSRSADRFVYSIWRRSEYVTWFPLPALYDALNEAEGTPGGWGGAATIGGSPRGTGSRLSPAQVRSVIWRVIDAAEADQPPAH